MQDYAILRIDFYDRFGLGYEVFELMRNKRINLVGMEAIANQEMVLKFECDSAENLEQVMDDLKKIDGITAVKRCDSMPYEQRENELMTILNSVSEGIIAINQDGMIIHTNHVAKEILPFLLEKKEELYIGDVLEAKIPILETLKTGKPYSLKEMKIRKERKVFHYLTSGVPIVNEKGQVMGAVATIKDYKQVEEMLSKVDRSRKLTSFDDIVFQSSKMRHLLDTAKMVAKGDSSILLRGESGTGKELFAKAIHVESNRSSHPFIAISCAALPENLLESELFGYEEGSFTGAIKGGKKGLFEQSNSGTLFLDEIGEISPQIQVRLLRVLQEKSIRRVGGNVEIPVDVRIITATHRNLEDMVEKGAFREDLYYRLNVIPLRIPPLRERPEDIPLIAHHLMQKICLKLNKPGVHLAEETIEYLLAQPWQGNVRQLENTLERILNVTNQPEITLQHFYDWANFELNKHSLNHESNFLQMNIPIEQCPNLKDIVREVEKQVILHVMKTHASSRKAGQVLGVSNTTVLNKLKSFGIVPE